VRNPLFPAVFLAVVLAAGPPTSAQVAIDTSSPDAVMASLAELHNNWTHDQFVEFMRAAMIANLPQEMVSKPLREGRELSDLIEGLGLLHLSARHVPLVLEYDPFIDDAHLSASWFQRILERPLRDRSIQEVVRAGHAREQAFIAGSQDLYSPILRERVEELENAEAQARSAAERRSLDRLRRELGTLSEGMDRWSQRLEKLRSAGAFEPGALGCRLSGDIDLTSEGAMIAGLAALAETCPQRRLIRFLRAAAFLSEVPHRSEAIAISRAAENLSFAMEAIAGLAGLLQHDVFFRDHETVVAALKRILGRALPGRTISEVMRDGEKVERAFLPALRAHLMHQLQAEIERRRETSEQDAAAPQRPSREAQRFRGYIERIERRLAMLEGGAPEPARPGAN